MVVITFQIQRRSLHYIMCKRRQSNPISTCAVDSKSISLHAHEEINSIPHIFIQGSEHAVLDAHIHQRSKIALNNQNTQRNIFCVAGNNPDKC